MSTTQLVILVLLAVLLSSPTLANEQRERNKLDKIQRDIQNLQKTIKGTGEQQGTLNNELKNSEVMSAKINLKIITLEKQLAGLRIELKSLHNDQENLEISRKNQQALIASQITSAYRLGNDESIKLLLNQKDPETISRTLKYYGYFLRARSEKLNHYRKTLQALKEVETAITDRHSQLLAHRSELEKQRQQLGERQKQRRDVLTQLNQKITTSQQHLNKLKSEQNKLESVLKALKKGIEQLSLPATEKSFTARKGSFSWPVSGRLTKYYGATRNAGIRWNGWLLQAKEGSPVNAIHHGRVIFSDYLRGHGLLMIIDHGDGYMSLYAHNQVLLKDIGEWVLSGESIAKVGNSGGQEDYALYFEIRHNGKPTNPKPWLQKRG
jgi:septal ring factor EnvC (AmiA/AmiB activator)